MDYHPRQITNMKHKPLFLVLREKTSCKQYNFVNRSDICEFFTKKCYAYENLNIIEFWDSGRERQRFKATVLPGRPFSDWVIHAALYESEGRN